MAPIRRYLRISSHSVLEVRVYLDNPTDAHRWLLHSSDPALPRIIQAIRPLVLPKLREENERSNRKGGSSGTKKKGVKDVVSADDFDVSIFLTDLSTSHSLLTRAKVFAEKKEGKKNAGAPKTGSRGLPVEIADGGGSDGGDDDDESTAPVPNLRQEDSEDEQKPNLDDLPMHDPGADGAVEISDSDGEGASPRGGSGRRGGDDQDDKKKLGFRTSYDGFRIYGRILCLVVKRKASARGKQVAGDATGQAVMENWIASTQENAAMMDE